MADGVNFPLTGSGDATAKMASDEVLYSGETMHSQIVRIVTVDGTEGSKTVVDLRGQQAMADSLPVAIASDQSAVPVSAASLPLPSGAATGAKQDTGNTSLGTIAGAVSGTEVQVDVLTLPAVTGTVTANAGTNLNTSALALEAGGNLAAAAASLASIDTGTPAALGQAAMAASQPVVIASDQTTVPVSLTSTTVTGTVAVTQSGTWDEVGINDSGNSITVDAPVGTPAFVRLSDGAAAITTLPVSLATLPALVAGTANIGDVDVLTLPAGTVAGSASLPAGANNIGDVDVLTIAAGDNNIGNVDIVTMPNVTIGTMAALVAGTANIGDVDVLTLPALVAGTANIGDVDVLTVPADPFGVNADAASATGSISAKLRSIAAVQLPAALAANGGLKVEGVAGGVAIPISAASLPSHAVTNVGTFATQVDGAALTALQLIDDVVKADDAGFTVATDKVGMIGALAVAIGADPDAADANDAAAPITNRHRVQFVIGGHPNVLTLKHTTITTAVTDVAMVTQGAGGKICVTRLTVTLDNASTVFPSVLIGFGATNTPTTIGVLAAHGGVPAGGGFTIGDGSGVIGQGADGDDLRITTVGNATGNGVQVTFSYFILPS